MDKGSLAFNTRRLFGLCETRQNALRYGDGRHAHVTIEVNAAHGSVVWA